MPYLCWRLQLGQGRLECTQSCCLLPPALCPRVLPFHAALALGRMLVITACRSPSVNFSILPLKYIKIFLLMRNSENSYGGLPPLNSPTSVFIFSHSPSPRPKGMVMSCSCPCSRPPHAQDLHHLPSLVTPLLGLGAPESLGVPGGLQCEGREIPA